VQADAGGFDVAGETGPLQGTSQEVVKAMLQGIDQG
jgi:hypothetical protein